MSLVVLLVVSVFAGTVAFSGSALAAQDVTSNDANTDLDTPGTYYAGQSTFIDVSQVVAADVTKVQLRPYDGTNLGTPVTEIPLDDQQQAVVNTSSLQGQYVITTTGKEPIAFDDGTGSSGTLDNASFEVLRQDFSVSPDSVNVTNATGSTTEVSFSSTRADYQVNVSAEDLSASELEAAFGANGTVSGTGVLVNASTDTTFDVAFSELAAGNYDLTFDVVDSDAEDSMSVNVDERGSVSYGLASAFPSDERGDVGEFTVELENVNTVTVRFGSPAVNYAVWADVTDADNDGQVTVEVHTYETDSGNASSVLTLAEGSDDAISNQSFTAGANLNTPIEAGDYGITVYDSDGEEQAFGTFVLNERSTDGAQTWVSATSNFATPVDVYNAVSQGDTVAQGGTVVVQVQASGLYDYFELGTEGLSVNITQTNPGANQDPAEIGANNYRVVPDAENNTFFLVVDTSGTQPGQIYRATFNVSNETANGNKLLPSGASQSVNATFSIVEREVSFDTNRGDVYAVPQGAVNVTGTSTFAPGTEFQVTARSSAENLLKSQTVTVDSDGTWAAPFDFSDVENGTEFTFTNSRTDASVSALVDTGLRAEGETTTTTTTTAETTTTTTETTTTTTETTTTETTTTTTETTTTETTTTEAGGDGGIPGFGVGVALVALLAAALLAIRRSRSR